MRIALSNSDFSRLHKDPCVLVPTRGCLHAGHAALIRAGVALATQRRLSGGCVVSIFVHPTQFESPVAFDAFPRDLDADLKICHDAGAACVLAPRDEEVFPPGQPPQTIPLPAAATAPGLEDALDPTFGDTCRTTLRLIEIVRADSAVLGDKDWQHVQAVRAMTRTARITTQVLGSPTTRDLGGLPTSSSNTQLSTEDHARAQSLARALRQSLSANTPEAAEDLMARVLADHDVTPDYAVIREAVTLETPAASTHATQWRALISATFGQTRIIDNAAWNPRA